MAARQLIGFSNLDENNMYARHIRELLEEKLRAYPQIELIARDNALDSQIARKHTQEFAERDVTAAIVFHVDERENPNIVAPLLAKGISIISIDLYIPMSIYVGADSIAGAEMAGQELGRWIKKNWKGYLDKILIMTYQQVLSVAQMRFEYSTKALKRSISYDQGQILYLDTGEAYEETRERMSNVLNNWRDLHHIAIVCINDKTAERILQIARELGRSEDIAVISFDGTEIAMHEFQRDDCRLVTSVLFKQEVVSDKLLEVILKICAGEPVLRRYMIEPILLTKENYQEFGGG